MRTDAVRGHLDGMILSVLEAEPLHGYAVIERLGVRSGGQRDLPTGTVYPALRRLESAGHVASKWSEVGGRKRRTYRLTASGRRALAARREEWSTFARVVGDVLEAT